MKRIFAPNINGPGRAARAAISLALLVGAWVLHRDVPWLAVALVLAAIFTTFEALRGWCALRACGVKTPL